MMPQERNIVLVGNPVLRQEAVTVKRFGENLNALLDDMYFTMKKNEGVGLAAPQIGISKRIIVMDDGSGLLELINPEIVKSKGKQIDLERCLSVPDRGGKVKRAMNVTVRGQDRDGNIITIDAKGFTARILQHEIDHLHGRLFIDIMMEEDEE